MARWFDLSAHRLTAWLDQPNPQSLIILPISATAPAIKLSDEQVSLLELQGADIELDAEGSLSRVAIPLVAGLPSQDWWRSVFPNMRTQDMNSMAMPVVYTKDVPDTLRAQWLWRVPKSLISELPEPIDGLPHIESAEVITTLYDWASHAYKRHERPEGEIAYVTLAEVNSLQLLGDLQISDSAITFWNMDRQTYLSQPEEVQLLLNEEARSPHQADDMLDPLIPESLVSSIRDNANEDDAEDATDENVIDNVELIRREASILLGLKTQVSHVIEQLSFTDREEALNALNELYEAQFAKDVDWATGAGAHDIENALNGFDVKPSFDALWYRPIIQNEYPFAKKAAAIVEQYCGTPSQAILQMRALQAENTDQQVSAWDSWRNIRSAADQLGLNAIINPIDLDVEKFYQVQEEGVDQSVFEFSITYTDQGILAESLASKLNALDGSVLTTVNGVAAPGITKSRNEEDQALALSLCVDKVRQGEQEDDSQEISHIEENDQSSHVIPSNDMAHAARSLHYALKHGALKISNLKNAVTIEKHADKNYLIMDDWVLGVFEGRTTKEAVLGALSKTVKAYDNQVLPVIRDVFIEDVNALLALSPDFSDLRIHKDQVNVINELPEGSYVEVAVTLQNDNDTKPLLERISNQSTPSLTMNLTCYERSTYLYVNGRSQGSSHSLRSIESLSPLRELFYKNIGAQLGIGDDSLNALIAALPKEDAADSNNNDKSSDLDWAKDIDVSNTKPSINDLFYSLSSLRIRASYALTQLADRYESNPAFKRVLMDVINHPERSDILRSALLDAMDDSATFDEVVERFDQVLRNVYEYDYPTLEAVEPANQNNISVSAQIRELLSLDDRDDEVAFAPSSSSADVDDSVKSTKVRDDSGEYIPFARKHEYSSGLWSAKENSKVQHLMSQTRRHETKSDLQAARAIARKAKLDNEWPEFTADRRLELMREGFHPIAIEIQHAIRKTVKSDTNSVMPGNSSESKYMGPSQWIAMGVGYQTHVRSLRQKAEKIRSVTDALTFIKDLKGSSYETPEHLIELKQQLLPDSEWYVYSNYSAIWDNVDGLISAMEKHENAVQEMPFKHLNSQRHFGSLNTSDFDYVKALHSHMISQLRAHVNTLSSLGQLSVSDLESDEPLLDALLSISGNTPKVLDEGDGIVGEKSINLLRDLNRYINSRSSEIEDEFIQAKDAGLTQEYRVFGYMREKAVESFLKFVEINADNDAFWHIVLPGWRKDIDLDVEEDLRTGKNNAPDLVKSTLLSKIESYEQFISIENKPQTVIDFIEAGKEIEEIDIGVNAPNYERPAPRADNLQRTGVLRREGDITEDQFKEAFGIRGVQYGNYVGQSLRQTMLNLAYDSFSDMAEALGVPYRFMGFNGSLAIAFGARGRGKAAAHYEPGLEVINLTKTMGAGALAHEMAHAIDHHLAKYLRSSQNYSLSSVLKGRYVSDSVAGSVESGYARAFRMSPDIADTSEAKKGVALLQSQSDLMNAFCWANMDRSNLLTFAESPEKRKECLEQYQLDRGDYFKRSVLNPLMLTQGDLLRAVECAKRHAKNRLEKEGESYDEAKLDIALRKIASSWPHRSEPFLNTVANAVSEGGYDAVSDYFSTLKNRTYMYSREIFAQSVTNAINENDKNRPLDVLEHDFVKGWVDSLGYDCFKRIFNEAKNQSEIDRYGTNFLRGAKALDNGKSKGYWSTAVELWARGFSAIIHDQTEKQGVVNDFATAYSAPKWGLGNQYVASPNPEGYERALMNKAASAFMLALQDHAAKVCETTLNEGQMAIFKDRFQQVVFEINALDVTYSDEKERYLNLFRGLIEIADDKPECMSLLTDHIFKKIQDNVESSSAFPVYFYAMGLLLESPHDSVDKARLLSYFCDPHQEGNSALRSQVVGMLSPFVPGTCDTSRAKSAQNIALSFEKSGILGDMIQSYIADAAEHGKVHELLYNSAITGAHRESVLHYMTNTASEDFNAAEISNMVWKAYSVGGNISDLQKGIDAAIHHPYTMTDVFNEMINVVSKAQHSGVWNDLILPSSSRYIEAVEWTYRNQHADTLANYERRDVIKALMSLPDTKAADLLKALDIVGCSNLSENFQGVFNDTYSRVLIDHPNEWSDEKICDFLTGDPEGKFIDALETDLYEPLRGKGISGFIKRARVLLRSQNDPLEKQADLEDMHIV